MPGFFNNPPWCPSESSRKLERGNMIVEGGTTVVSSLVENGVNSPYAGIFRIVPQIVMSSTAITREDTHLSERILHILQSLLGLAQLAAFIYMIYDDETCATFVTDVCKTVQILRIIHVALLGAGGAGSEFLGTRAAQIAAQNSPQVGRDQAVLDEDLEAGSDSAPSESLSVSV